MAQKILVADDEERWCTLLRDFLNSEGYAVIIAHNGQEALERLRKEGGVELAILDVMMPVLDGISACRAIREFSDVPIIILTAKDDEDSELLGFACGADEYLSKPVRLKVLAAHIKVLLKRSNMPAGQLTLGELTIEPHARCVYVAGQRVRLTPHEYDLLLHLMRNLGTALGRQEILRSVWKIDFYGDTRLVDTHIKNLRAKLGVCGNLIRTVRGNGYMLEQDDE
jgi:DNA-binding response OmpR family regulator